MALRRQLVEDRGVGAPGAGRGLLAAGQLQFPKQDVADLFGRAEVEGPADQFMGLGLQLDHPHRKLVGEPLQGDGVDHDPVQLHAGQNGGERPLQGLIDGGQALPRQTGFELVIEPEGDVCVLGGIAGGRFQGHMFETLGRLAGAGDGLEADRFVPQPELGKLVHAVAVQAGLQDVGDQHGVFDGRRLDAVAAQDRDIVLGVLGDLEHRRVFQEGLQPLHDQRERQLFDRGLGILEVEPAIAVVLVAYGNIAGLPRRDGQRHAAKVGVGG